MDTNENMAWEMEAPVLAALPRITPYRVPADYFENLSGQITSVVRLDNIKAKEQYGFKVPTGYFESLSTNIQSRIRVETLALQDSGFRTPPQYFEKLQAEILRQTAQQEQEVPAKQKVLKLWQNDFFKYASAACFVLLAASGLYFNQQKTVQENRYAEISSEAILYNIDENVIIEHLKESQSANNSSMPSQSEIENYLLDHYSIKDLSDNL